MTCPFYHIECPTLKDIKDYAEKLMTFPTARHRQIGLKLKTLLEADE